MRSAGFEPATPGLGILCSIQLSYERSWLKGYYNTIGRAIRLEGPFLGEKMSLHVSSDPVSMLCHKMGLVERLL